MKIKVRVNPRSSQNLIVGVLADGTFKVRLSVPPIDGRANAALINLLAAHFKINKNRVQIISGQTKKTKIVEILL